MKVAILSLILFSLPISANNLCKRYSDQVVKTDLIQDLANKLNYSFEELCFHPRILDIQFENRRAYSQERDRYETFTVTTLHYNEYSCDYYFSLDLKDWDSKKQNCYNTW